jgi:basic membrane lipoprotein Med (substrate-binding protein (PBP1-ABC) superfamily)
MPAGGQARRMLEAARKTRRRQRPHLRVNWRSWPGMAKAAAWWAGLSRRARMITLAGAAVVVAGCVAVGVVVSLPPAPRARQYLAFTACLLTDARGLNGQPAATAWAGMEDASLATHAKAEYLPVMSGPTAADAAPFLASLTARQCKVVIAAGPAPSAAVAARARQYPAIRFAVVGGKATGRNVTELTGSASTVRSSVDSLVTAAVNAST